MNAIDGFSNSGSVTPLNTGASLQPTQIEFDLHGLVGIRLVDPTSRDVAAVTRQLGVVRTPLSREPDITLRFVERLVTPPLRHLGFRKLGFSDNALFVLEDGANGGKARIPFTQLGRKCEIVCESGLQSVPLLKHIVALTAQAKGFACVHASAFMRSGVGVVMAGWAESGKTTALLGFAARGAELIGEDCVLVSRDGNEMCGLPTMIELSTSHLENLPDIRRRVNRSRLLALRALHGLRRMQDARQRWGNRPTSLGRLFRRILASLEERTYPTVAPQAIFGKHLGPLAGRPDKFFLLVSHDEPWVEVRAIPSSEMALRLAHLAQHEQIPLWEHYLAFKFAFPEAANPNIERSFQAQYEILSQALAGKDTYTVWHPYPLAFSDLYQEIEPLVRQTVSGPMLVPPHGIAQVVPGT
jgi:hypothetical protein